MRTSKLRHTFLYVFIVCLLVGRSTLSVAQPSDALPIEGLESNLPKQTRKISDEEGPQSSVKTQPIMLAQNSATPLAAVPSDIIAEISVEGSQRVDPATVISYLGLRVGDRYDRSKLDDSLKAIFSTGYFRDVKFRREGNLLVVEVKENPVINRIVFEGNSRIKSETLLAELKLKPRLVYTLNKLQSDAERIVEIYRRSGRFAAKVEPKLIELDQNRLDIVFEISEGDRTKVHRIVFIGNKRFSDGQLRSVISTKESRWYRFLTSGDFYDPNQVEYDQNLLRKYYLRNGYADFQTVSAVAELTPSHDGFLITFTLDEGERYDLGSVEIKNNLRGINEEVLYNAIDVVAGETYNDQLIDEAVQSLTAAISKIGIPFFDVVPKVIRQPEAKLVDVTFDIVPGKKVFVQQIDISGNIRTLDSVIRREMQLSEGDAFNTAKIKESERRIRRLGFFEKVKIETLPSRTSDQVKLAVTVVEKSTGELSFGAGLSSDTGVMGQASIRERNLLGKGQDLALSFGVSLGDNQVNLSFTEPYFLDRPLSAGFDIFASEQDRERESAYNERAAGFGLRVGYEPATRWRQTWGYSIKDSSINASSGASRYIVAQDGKSTTSKITHRITYDNTDNYFDPSEGLRLSWSSALAGLGGSIAYFNNEGKASQFFPLAEKTVLQLSARAGAIFGLGKDVRLIDRYFLGGTNFRGFSFSGVGARDASTEDALGGNYYYLSTAEMTFPLGLADDAGVLGRAFIDVGSVFGTDDKGININDSSAPRASIGVGLTWASVMGPIRLDFGYAVLKKDFDQDQVFSFTFGTRF